MSLSIYLYSGKFNKKKDFEDPNYLKSLPNVFIGDSYSRQDKDPIAKMLELIPDVGYTGDKVQETLVTEKIIKKATKILNAPIKDKEARRGKKEEILKFLEDNTEKLVFTIGW